MKLGVENNMQSIWTESSQRLNFKSLKGDVKTDVLIIGGGMAGILIAYFLEQAGVDYMLVEGKTIGDGITKKTTAKITSQHGLIYDKLIIGQSFFYGGYYEKRNYYCYYFMFTRNDFFIRKYRCFL